VLFGVIGVALAPMCAHALVDWFGGQPIEWVPKEAYVFALVTWGGLFYEIRLHGEKPIPNELLKAYHRTLHWWSMAGAGASALAYGLIESHRDATVTSRLSGWVWLAVLLSAGMFLLYKGPMLWFEAE
jgi:hypothetical protein